VGWQAETKIAGLVVEGKRTAQGGERERAKPLTECGPNAKCEVCSGALPCRSNSGQCGQQSVVFGGARHAKGGIDFLNRVRSAVFCVGIGQPGFRVGLAVATLGKPDRGWDVLTVWSANLNPFFS
jgi:hypothetical protein